MKKKWLITGTASFLLSSLVTIPMEVLATEEVDATSQDEQMETMDQGIPIQRIEQTFADNQTHFIINTNKSDLTFYTSDPDVLAIDSINSSGIIIGSHVDYDYQLKLTTHKEGSALLYALDENNEVDPNSVVMFVVHSSVDNLLNPAVVSESVSMLRGNFVSKSSELTNPAIIWMTDNSEIIDIDSHVKTTRYFNSTGVVEYQEQVITMTGNAVGTTNVYGFQNGHHVKTYQVSVTPVISNATVYEHTPIPFETTYENDATLPKGEEVVTVEGVEGQLEEVFLVTYEDGVEVSRSLVSSSIVKEPVHQVIKVGTAVPITSIALDKSEVEIEKGDNATLVASILPEDTTDEAAIQWTTSDPSVATVDQNGVITAVDGGIAEITASVGGLSATATVTVPYTTLYEDYPVGYAWDFGVWSNYENGSKVASSFNDFAGKKLAIVKEATDRNNNVWVLFQIDGETIGWVNKAGLRSQLPKVDVLYTDTPVSDAWNYGVWTNYVNGSKVSGSLNNYRGKTLHIIAEATDKNGTPWVQFQVDDRIIGWVSQWGLENNKPSIPVLYTDKAVADAWNYGVWTNYENGTKLPGSLNNYAGKTLSIIDEKVDSNDIEWVQFQVDGKTIGWVSKLGLVENKPALPVLYTDKAVSDAWNYGVWSNYENGTKLPGSLNNYAGKTLSIVAEATDANGTPWVQFQVDGKTVGWVSKRGITSGELNIPDFYYSVLPVSQAWNYGIWSNYENGKYITSLNDYAGRFVRVVEEVKVGPNNIWAKITVDGKDIGWVSKRGLRVGNPNSYILYSRKPVANSWDYSVWSNHTNGKKVGGSLNDHAGKMLNIIEEATVDGTKWVRFEYQGNAIGWVARQGLEK